MATKTYPINPSCERDHVLYHSHCHTEIGYCLNCGKYFGWDNNGEIDERVAFLTSEDRDEYADFDFETVDAVLEAKANAGPEAYLWLHDSGDCILWSSEEDSEGDNGQNALERWQLSLMEYRWLAATSDVDYLA
jgi:hypothetical protein